MEERGNGGVKWKAKRYWRKEEEEWDGWRVRLREEERVGKKEGV